MYVYIHTYIPTYILFFIYTCTFLLSSTFGFSVAHVWSPDSRSKPVRGTAKHGSQETRDKLNKRTQGRSTKSEKGFEVREPPKNRK